jgi:hypothetical protein
MSHRVRGALAVMALVIAGTALLGNVQVPAGAGPFYARIERNVAGDPLVPHDEEWAVVPFYRQPECVRPDFNLLDLFDIPACFGCQDTVAGFEIWRTGPGLDPVPIQVVSFGMAGMPIWLAPWDELQVAMADDVLTIDELEAIAVKGQATFFKETLHPYQAKLQMVGKGTLDDGRSFLFSSEETHGVIQTTRIEVR